MTEQNPKKKVLLNPIDLVHAARNAIANSDAPAETREALIKGTMKRMENYLLDRRAADRSWGKLKL